MTGNDTPEVEQFTLKPYDSLEAGFMASVEGNPNVDPLVDIGLITAGVTVARQIDQTMQMAEAGLVKPQDVTKAIYLIPHLTGIMKELLATPAARDGAKNLGKRGLKNAQSTLKQLRGE